MRKVIINILSVFSFLLIFGQFSLHAENEGYLIEGESFQFKGKWFAQRESGAFGSSVLRLGGGGSSSPDFDAVTVVRILHAGEYSVWVRSADYKQQPGTRLFRLTVNDTPMALAGGHGKQGYHWEKVGTVSLPAGEALLRLHDESRRNARCDAVLLVKDNSIDPLSADRKELGRLRRNPVRLDAETSAPLNISIPLTIPDGSPVSASVDNGSIRLSFVSVGGRSLACMTELKGSGGWRRFHSAVEDSKVYLLTSEESPFDNKNFYPSWTKADVGRTITYRGSKIRVKAEEDLLNPFNAGMLSEAIPVQAVRTGERSVTVHYITKDGSRMEGIWTLPEKGTHIEVEMRCKAASEGMCSIVMSSFQPLDREQVSNVLMPPMFQFRRVPEHPLMMLSSMMQQPLSVVETVGESGAKVSSFICADLAGFTDFTDYTEVGGFTDFTGVGGFTDLAGIPDSADGWGSADFSPAGFSLHSPSGGIQPLAFSPVMGMADSRVAKGQILKRKFVMGAVEGGWNDALEYVSGNVFNVRDYRHQDYVSLTDAYFNMIELMKNDEFGGWDKRMKGFYDIEGDPGTAPTVVHCSPLAVISAAIVAMDEELYVSRALPTIEYTLSRSGYRWADDIVPTGYNKTYKTLELNPFSSQFTTSCYEGISQMLSGLNPWLEAVALPSGEIRKTKGYSTPILPWVQYISAYRMTGKKEWLDKAVSTADRFISTSLYEPSSALAGQMAFYNANVYPHWWNLIDLYEITKDGKYLEAASYGAASTLAGIRTYPLVRDVPQTIHRGDRYDGNTTMWWKGKEKFRLGFPRVEGDVREKQVPSWLVSPVGLGFEQPGTYFLRSKGKLVRPVFLSSWAPHLLRLYRYTDKEIYNIYARNAVIGRFANYPGYYATGFTDITISSDFPYKGPDVSSIYYHHIPPHIAFTWDYLVSETILRSEGDVDFPYSFQEGFVWFASRLYGGGAGRIYNDRNARLFMRKGMVSSDNPRINYVTAVSDRNFWILLTNESSEAETVSLGLDLPEGIRLSGKPAAVYGKGRKGAKLSAGDGAVRVSVPGKGFLAVSLPVELSGSQSAPLSASLSGSQSAPQSASLSGSQSASLSGSQPGEAKVSSQLPALEHGYEEVDSGTAFGKIRVFRIRSPFGWDSIYGFAETSPQKGKEMSMSVECNGKVFTVSRYPFEWSVIRLRPDEEAVVKVTLTEDGRVREMEDIVMKGE